MLRWIDAIAIAVAIFTSTIILLKCAFYKPTDRIIAWDYAQPDVAPMPLVEDSNPSLASFNQLAPTEERGPEFRRFLSASLKIRVSGASGSGTIVYFDQSTGWAYVTTCGHLWSGTRTAEQLRNRPQKAKVVTWYHNSKKLDSTKEYEAEVLFWSNNRGYDTACMRFKPDWIPTYFPIAEENHQVPQGEELHSLGCDGGREVARYAVEFVEYRGADLITRRNSPRPGRSGGGLMTEDGWYVGTCWGTSDTRSGNGIGYFTPLRAIHKIYKDNGYDWLLEIGKTSMAQLIPIHDWQNPSRIYDPSYIPTPGRPIPIQEFYYFGPRYGYEFQDLDGNRRRQERDPVGPASPKAVGHLRSEERH